MSQITGALSMSSKNSCAVSSSLTAIDQCASPSSQTVSCFSSVRLVLLAFMTLVSSWLLFGCATPYGVTPAGLRGAYEEVNISALTSKETSSLTRAVLYRHNLLEQFDKDPEFQGLVRQMLQWVDISMDRTAAAP